MLQPIGHILRTAVLPVIGMVFGVCMVQGALAQEVPAWASGGSVQVLPWRTLQGGLLESGPAGSGGRHIQFGRPVAVSANGNDVYIADAGRRMVYRYDRSREVLIPFYSLSSDSKVRLFASRDRSLFITDPVGRRVLQIGPTGKLITSFSDSLNLVQPVAVAVDEFHGDVLVADEQYNHILKFNRLGRLAGVIVPRRAGGGSLHGVSDMAVGPDGIYMVDRLERRVIVIGFDGVYRYSLGGHALDQPAGVAVDRDNRVFIADAFSNTINIYTGGSGMSMPASTGSGAGRFHQVGDMSVDEGRLYVIDGNSIQILQVTP